MTSVAVISCDTTSVMINASWVRPDYKPKKFNKVLVISDVKVITRRQRVEKTVAERLKKNGINAIPGITVITPGEPGEKKPGKENFIKKMKDMNFDGVILIKLVAVKDDSSKAVREKEKTTVEHFDNLSWTFGDFYGWGYPGYGYYGPSYNVSYTMSSYEISYDPNWTDTAKKAVLDLDFYEIGKDLLVWKAQSSVGKVDVGNIDIFIDSFSKTIVDKLIAMKLVQ
jgi:hypothetical protein